MEDLGRIVIDVNATGGGGVGGGQGSRMMDRVGGALTKAGVGIAESGAMALAQQGAVGRSLAGALSAAGPGGLAVAAALGGMAVGGLALKKTFEMLNNAAKNLTESLRGVSPQVMVADAMNEIMMFQEKLRASALSGAALARRELAQGRIDRALFRLMDIVGRISAAIVTPVLDMVGKILEAIVEKLIPALTSGTKVTIDFIGKLAQNIGLAYPMLSPVANTIMMIAMQMSNSLAQLASNTAPQYTGNEPFIADLRLMGAKI